MFINLTARKANGDFAVTSSAVLQARYIALDIPISDAQILDYILDAAKNYVKLGYDVEINQEANYVTDPA